jgi:hypothetical protein
MNDEPILIPISVPGAAQLTSVVSNLEELQKKLTGLGSAGVGSALAKLRSEVTALSGSFGGVKGLGKTTVSEIESLRDQLRTALGNVADVIKASKDKIGGEDATGLRVLRDNLKKETTALVNAMREEAARVETAKAEADKIAEFNDLERMQRQVRRATAAAKVAGNTPYSSITGSNTGQVTGQLAAGVVASNVSANAILGLPSETQRNQSLNELKEWLTKGKAIQEKNNANGLVMMDSAILKFRALEAKRIDDEYDQLQKAASKRIALEKTTHAELLALKKTQAAELAATAAANITRAAIPAKSMVNSAMDSATGSYSSLANRATISPVFDKSSFDMVRLATKEASAAFSELSSKNVVHPDASKKLKALRLDLNDAHSAARGLASGFGLMSLTYGAVLPLLAGAAVSHTFKNALQDGAKFEQSLFVISELAGTATNQMASLSKSLLDMGTSTMYGPLEAAKGLEVLTLAGLTAADAMLALKPTLNFAAAGGVTLEAAAETSVAVAAAFGYSAREFAVVQDVIAKTAAESMSSVTDMSSAFKTASVIAQTYHVSLVDVSQSLSSLADIGIKGSAAGTSLRNFYSEITKSGGKVGSALKAMNVDVYESVAAGGALKGTLQIVKEIGSALDTKTPRAYSDLFKTLSNERGGKLLAAQLEEVNKERLKMNEDLPRTKQMLIDEGKAAQAAAIGHITFAQAAQQLIDKRKKFLEESAGFTFFAAVEQQLTTLGTYKGILASLETGFIKAFNNSSDAVYVLGVQLREALNSEEFQGALNSIVAGVMSLATAIADTVAWMYKHDDVMKLVGTSLASGAILWASYSAVVATAGLTTAGVATTMITSIRAVAAAFLASPLGLIALAAAATMLIAELWKLGSAYLMVGDASLQASAKQREAAKASIEDSLKANSLKIKGALEAYTTQADSLEKEIALRKSGMSTQEAQTRVMGEQTLQRVKTMYDERKALTELIALDIIRQGINSGKDVFKSMDEGEAFKKGEFAKIEKEKQAALSNTRDAIERVVKAQKTLADMAAKSASAPKRPIGDDDTTVPDYRSGKSAESKILRAFNDEKAGFLAANKVRSDNYKLQEQMLKGSYDTQAAILDNKNKNLLISDGAYQAQQIVNLADYESNATKLRTKAMEDERTKLSEHLSKIEASKVSNPQKNKAINEAMSKADVSLSTIAKDQADQDNAAMKRLQVAAQEAEGRLVKLQRTSEAFWAAEEVASERLSAQAQLDLQNRTATAAMQAANNAGFAEEYRFKALISTADLELNRTQSSLLAIQTALADSREDDGTGPASLKTQRLVEVYIQLNAQLQKEKELRDKLAGASPVKQLEAQAAAMIKSMRSAAANDPFAAWGKGLKAVFGESATGIATMLGSMKKLGDGQKEYDKALSISAGLRAKGGDSALQADELQLEATYALAEAKVAGYQEMAAGLKSYFDKSSNTYKVIEGLEKGLAVFQMGMALQKMATDASVMAARVAGTAATSTAVVSLGAAESAATVATASPGIMAKFLQAMGPWGWAAGAAAIVAIGGAVTGSPPTVTMDDFASQKANDGSGGIVGDSKAKSESIENSLAALVSMAKPELVLITEMVNLLQGIKDGIKGTTSALLASGLDTSSLSFKGSSSSSGGGIAGAIFGSSSSSTSLSDSGLAFGNQSVKEMLAGVAVKAYQIIRTDSSSSGFLGFGSSSNTDYSSKFSNVSGDVTKALTDTTVKMMALVTSAASKLGASDTQISAVGNIRADLGKVQLMDKTEAEMQAILTAVFSKLGDSMAQAVLPSIAAFRLTGEGYLETLTRVAGGMEKGTNVAAKLGLVVGNVESIVNKHGDVATELVRQAVVSSEKTLSGARVVTSGIGMIINGFSGSADELAEYYTGLVSVRLALTTLGFSTNTVTAALIKGAGSLEALQAGLTDFVEGFLDPVEKLEQKQATMGAAWNKLASPMTALGLSVPKSAEEFKQLVFSLKNGGSASQELLGQVLLLSGGMRDLFDTMTIDFSDFISGFLTPLESLARKQATMSVEWDKLAAPMAALGLTIPTTAEGYKQLVLTLEAGGPATENLLRKVLGLSGGMAGLFDGAKYSLTDFSTYMKDIGVLYRKALNFTGSIADAKALGLASEGMFSESMKLIDQIKGMAMSSSESMQAAIRQVNLDVMTAEQKYALYDKEAQANRDMLKTVTDPQLVEKYSTKLRESIMSAWGTLTDEQKKATSGEFTKLLSDGDKLTTDRYNASVKLVDDTNKRTSEAMAKAIGDAMAAALARDAEARVAEAARNAARDAKIAADAAATTAAINAAADKLNATTINVVVTTQTAAVSEVTTTTGGGGGGGTYKPPPKYIPGYVLDK